MNLLLKAKHWQLFMVFFIIPAIIYVFMMTSTLSEVFAAANSGIEPDPIVLFQNIRYCSLLLMAAMLIYYAWFWAVNVGLSKKIPQQAKMNLTRFKIFFFIPVVYFILIFVWTAFFMEGFMASVMMQDEEAVRNIGIGMTIITPLHLFSIFCIFYMIYFTAKTLKTIELKREVTFSDFVVEFFMIWFLPIGIWILQPKINEMADSEDISGDELAPPPVQF